MKHRRSEDFDERLILEANKLVHSTLASSGEYNRSPHFRPENQAKVRLVLKSLIVGLTTAGTKRIGLDFGCGTGFIIHLVHDLLDEVYGIDITTEMMEQVSKDLDNVYLHEGRAEETPYRSNYFDVAFAYSFMDHLASPGAFLQEALRVLKPGGVLYGDLIPNRGFIEAVAVSERTGSDSPHISKEIEGALRNGLLYERNFGISSVALEQAEPVKTLLKGFDATELSEMGRSLGFKRVQVEYDWYLGQGVLMHSQPVSDSETIERYLREVLPASQQLFKYLRIFFWK